MRPDNCRAVVGGDQMRSQRAAKPFVRFSAHDRTDEAFARSADQKRQVESAPGVKPRDTGKALLGRLAEPDPRIEHNLLAGDARLPSDLKRAREELGHRG